MYLEDYPFNLMLYGEFFINLCCTGVDYLYYWSRVDYVLFNNSNSFLGVTVDVTYTF